MNIQAIRQRFSLFLKQFRIEDLKLLMKFLEIIVNEYKNSKASRLFDLLSEKPEISIDQIDLDYDEPDQNDYIEDSNHSNLRKQQNQFTKNKVQNEKYRRLKIINARKRLINGNQSNNGTNRSDHPQKSTMKINEYTSNVLNDQCTISSTNKDANNQDLNNSINSNSENYTENYREEKLENSDENNINDTHDLNANNRVNDEDQINDSTQIKEKNYNQNMWNNDDSNKKVFSRPSTTYNTDQNNTNSNYSNQSLNYLNEDSIDQMFDTNSNDDDYRSIDLNQNNKNNTNNLSGSSMSSWIYKSNLKETINNTTNLIKGVTKCAVCSDAASGTRYGVCVCEGCKEFFRRQRENTSNRQLYCVNGNSSCTINISNRTQCRKCRLDKCIKLGMKLVGK